MLNVFEDIYNIAVRGIPNYFRMLIVAIAVILSLWCIVRFLKKSNDKQPINAGYIVLLVVFIAIIFIYSFV